MDRESHSTKRSCTSPALPPMAESMRALAVVLLIALWGAAPASSQLAGGRSPFDCERYVPVPDTCPAETFVQEKVGGGLFDDEKQWLEARAAVISSSWEEYLGTIPAKIPDLDVLALVDVNVPRIGLASSGGGLRATLNTAGVVSALDARETKVRRPMPIDVNACVFPKVVLRLLFVWGRRIPPAVLS